MRRSLVLVIGLIVFTANFPTWAAQVEKDYRTEVVTLRNIPADEAAKIINDAYQTKAKVSSNGKIVLYDTTAKVHNAILTLQELDRKPAIEVTTPLRLKLSVKMQIQTKDQAPQNLSAYYERTCAADGSKCEFDSNICQLPTMVAGKESSENYRHLNFRLFLLPTFLPTTIKSNGMDKREISLEGNGWLNLSGNQTLAIQIAESFPVKTCIAFNKPALIAQGSSDLGQSKYIYEIMLTAIKEKGVVKTYPSIRKNTISTSSENNKPEQKAPETPNDHNAQTDNKK